MPQAHGSRLRLNHMSVADSGEYVCRANNNIDAQEASIMVSVSPSAGSPSGESDKGQKGTRRHREQCSLGGQQSELSHEGGGLGQGLCSKMPGFESCLRR